MNPSATEEGLSWGIFLTASAPVCCDSNEDLLPPLSQQCFLRVCCRHVLPTNLITYIFFIFLTYVIL
jgi:hypothetical protein